MVLFDFLFYLVEKIFLIKYKLQGVCGGGHEVLEGYFVGKNYHWC